MMVIKFVCLYNVWTEHQDESSISDIDNHNVVRYSRWGSKVWTPVDSNILKLLKVCA